MSSGGHNKRKDSFESTRRIDIRVLQKAGFFKQDCFYNAKWTRNGWDNGSMKFGHVNGHDFILAMYTITYNDTGIKENKEDRINLAYITTGYGKRAYFECPVCESLRTTLSFYNNGFKCRVCARLNYYSSQMNRDGFTKPDTMIKTILKKLKYECTNICDVYYAPKPKRMRYYTYEKLLKDLRYWQDMRTTAFVIGANKLKNRW